MDENQQTQQDNNKIESEVVREVRQQNSFILLFHLNGNIESVAG